MLGTNGTEIGDSVARAPGLMDDTEWTHDGPWGWLTLVSPQVEGIPRCINLTESTINIDGRIIKSNFLSSDYATIKRFAPYHYGIYDETTNGVAVNGIKASYAPLK